MSLSNTTASVIFLCGKIASGKSYYAKKLMEEHPAVLLSMDELFEICELDHFNELHSSLYPKLLKFLYAKASEIVRCGTNVIIDSGFWTRSERDLVRRIFSEMDVPAQWHYIDVAPETWAENIRQRNESAEREGYTAYIIDDERIREINAGFEVPDPTEIDVWYKNCRTDI